MTTMDADTHETLVTGWAKLGAGYLGASDAPTPDLERLILDTAVAGRHDPRTFTLAVTWLSRYASLVAEHRLCGLIRDWTPGAGADAGAGGGARASAGLGLMLDTALVESRRHDRRRNLKRAMDLCTPAPEPGPYFDIDDVNDAMRARARRRSSAIAARWNLWVEPLQLKHDALRPRAWVRDENPALQQRALFRGDLRSTILLTLRDDPASGASVSRLSRTCGVTRPAVENALHDLELANLVVCERRGRACRVRPAA